MGAVERARADVEAGRLWKARDRLEGYLDARPHDEEGLGLLADVCFGMGDLPAAGKYLYLTGSWEAGDASVREAFAERYGRNAVQMLRARPARPPIESYPEEVAARLARLVDEAREEGYVWAHSAETSATAPPVALLGWKPGAVLAVLALLTVGIWILGVVFLIQLVF